MSLVPGNRRSRTRSSRAALRVWAVGSRAYVHCPVHAAVVLTDEYEDVASATLDDGVEVEVRAWRPHGVAGPRYHVRTRDDIEGWLGAAHLRATRERPPTAAVAASDEPVPTAAGFVTYSRRFGQR